MERVEALAGLDGRVELLREEQVDDGLVVLADGVVQSRVAVRVLIEDQHLRRGRQRHDAVWRTLTKMLTSQLAATRCLTHASCDLLTATCSGVQRDLLTGLQSAFFSSSSRTMFGWLLHKSIKCTTT